MKQALSAVALVSTGFTATGLADALARVTDVPDSPEAQSRLQAISGGLSALPLTEGRKLLTEAVKASQDNPTVKVRASECRQIYGAFKVVVGFDKALVNIGWHKAVSLARNALEEHNLKADGGRLKSDAEKAADKLASNMAKPLAAEILAAGPDAVKDEGRMAEITTKATQSAISNMIGNEVQAHAERIVKAKGAKYAAMLSEKLLDVLTAAVPAKGIKQA
mgnify:CR=1 FL=1